MSLRIHICPDTAHADRIIAAEVNPGINPRKLTEPDIIVYDYSDDPNVSMQININKVCVIFDN